MNPPLNYSRTAYVVHLLMWRWVDYELANIRVELEPDLEE
jgi:hypothetical protein